MSSFRFNTTRLLSAASAIVLGGCAIHPEPLTDQELTSISEQWRARSAIEQEPIGGSIDLYEAMARAIKYNLDHRLEAAQEAVRGAELNLAHWNLLPNVVAQSGYHGRDNFNASSSFNLVTGVQNFGSSTSQDRDQKNADIAISWNILDFGLSYVRAHQTADRVLIAGETRRRIIHRIAEDVRSAYWRAVSAERLIKKLTALEGRTKKALSETRELFDNREASPITALTYARELVEIKRTIQELNRDLSVARTQLSALMNLPSGRKFGLVQPGRSARMPSFNKSASEMIEIALRDRSEMREIAYQTRINAREADAALLELLPGIQVFAGSNYDSNSFLLNADWLSWGAKASWHLIKVFQHRDKEVLIEAQDQLLAERASALSVAVALQVHVARIRFMNYRKEYQTSLEYYDVQQKLVEQIRIEAEAERVSEQTLIREEMNTLVAEVRRDIAYATLQTAFASLYASMGADPINSDIDTEQSVAGLTQTLRQLWFERGDHQGKAGARLAQK